MVYAWRWYRLDREQYQQCMEKSFGNNLSGLRQINAVIVILVSSFTVVPIAVEKDLRKAGVYLAAAFVSLLITLIANQRLKQRKQGKQVGKKIIYILTTVYYANIMLFGIYLGVWSRPDTAAVTFMGFLICALFLFINPPQYNLCLTLGALAVFIASSVIMKTPQLWIYDIINAVIAACISLFFGWEISTLRLASVLNVRKLENERNTYYDQSTVDELTRLRNRRDFTQTFQRYVTHYRSSDDWLCIAIADIDHFKDYNDHYGHPAGDDCLRAIGGVLNSLKESMNVYTARVGGEEFALLWFGKDASHADTVISRCTALIKDLNIPHEKSGVMPYVTISIGVYVMRCGSSTDMDALYNLADKALYAAKGSGRDCAIVCGDGIKQYRIAGGGSSTE